MHTISLDWADSLTEAGVPVVKAVLQEASPDLLLGADVVSISIFASFLT